MSIERFLEENQISARIMNEATGTVRMVSTSGLNSSRMILKRLESAQMLTVFKQEHNGRLRKYYRITDAGRDHITELMMEWEEIVRVFQYISREREQSHE